MPGKMQVLNIVVIALQYSLVALLYYFLYRIIKTAVQELNILTFVGQTTLSAKASMETNIAVQRPAKLMVVDDKEQLLSQAIFTITDSLAIGRSQYNNITINDSFVSHEHACVSRSKDSYLLADLNSTNGTLVNGQQIKEETVLKDGDLIQIGAVTLKFER